MLKIAFIHPDLDLGIGGAEHFSHEVDIYIPSPGAPRFDVFFVDRLSTCISLLRSLGHARVVFYCHFPDKLLANGEFTEDPVVRAERKLLKGGLLKRIYRCTMDWLEEFTTRMHGDSLKHLISSQVKFTGRVTPRNTVRSGNISDSRLSATLISLNRFEKKKNVALAVEAFARIRTQEPSTSNLRLVLGGTGYDPRLEDNTLTLYSLIDLVSKKHTLTYDVITPSSLTKSSQNPTSRPANTAVLFLLNFTTAQWTALLTSPSTIGLLYTPANGHFGIAPLEGVLCGIPVLARDSGGPVESIVDKPVDERTGWLREERIKMRVRAKKRAREPFGMGAMARGIEGALKEAVGMGKVHSRLMFWLVQ
ncbi:alpha-1,3-mannosyltransferase ALG2 [Lentinula edodes]|nr:alpha-1,3-mannosyltransferase ALG2 [Lentinula edodes]